MELLRQEFEVNYLLRGGLVRSSASGNFQGNDYSPSVRISSVNVYEVENTKTNFDDSIEQKAIFKIICPNNVIAGKVAQVIKNEFKKGGVLSLTGGFPNDSGIINISNSIDSFLALEQTQKNTNKNDK